MSVLAAEILAAPYTAYVGPVGATFPDVDGAPSGSWFLLGTSGTLNYDDPGVTVTSNETMNTFTGAGGTAPRKAWRTAEEFIVAFSLVDLSPEQHAKVLDDAAITTTAAGSSQAGEKAFSMKRGIQVHVYALLLRGLSPVDPALVSQYEVATCYQAANFAPAYSKANPAMLAVEFHALEQTPGVFATKRDQTATHT